MLVLISVKTGLSLGPSHFFLVLVLISVKTGLSLWPWANVVVALRVEVALYGILLVVPIVFFMAKC